MYVASTYVGLPIIAVSAPSLHVIIARFDLVMSAESNGPSLRLAYRLFLSCRRESLLYDYIDLSRIRHRAWTDNALIVGEQKQHYLFLEIVRGSGHFGRVRLWGGGCR